MNLTKYLPYADTPTPLEIGTWVLVSPSGKEYTGFSPIECLKAESAERIPAEVALGRIARGLLEDNPQQSP